MMEPEDVAAATMDALDKNRFETLVPFPESLIVRAKGFAPEAFRRMQEGRNEKRFRAQRSEPKNL